MGARLLGMLPVFAVSLCSRSVVVLFADHPHQCGQAVTAGVGDGAAHPLNAALSVAGYNALPGDPLTGLVQQHGADMNSPVFPGQQRLSHRQTLLGQRFAQHIEYRAKSAYLLVILPSLVTGASEFLPAGSIFDCAVAKAMANWPIDSL